MKSKPVELIDLLPGDYVDRFEKALLEHIFQDQVFTYYLNFEDYESLILEIPEKQVRPFINRLFLQEYKHIPKIKWITEGQRLEWSGSMYWTFEYDGKVYFNSQSYGSCEVCDGFGCISLREFKSRFEIWEEYDNLQELMKDMSEWELEDWEKQKVKDNEKL